MAADFFSRWSARKQQARAGQPLEEPPKPAMDTGSMPLRPAPLPPSSASASVSAPEGGLPATAPSDGRASGGSDPAPASPGGQRSAVDPAAALPTLEQARQLTPQSDFSPFVARGVAADVRNLALKKLFADPHFNVMDRLDTYIDDYGIADPLPPGMLGQLAGAKFLNLVQPEQGPTPTAPPPTAPAVALRDDTMAATVPAVAESHAGQPPTGGTPLAGGAAADSATATAHSPDPRPPHEPA